MLLSNNAAQEKQKIRFMLGTKTVTGLYSCTITNVYPDSLTVDVILSQTSKTIAGVSLYSTFLGRNSQSIAIPEPNTEAILASTEDNSNPFIVAYKPVSSYTKNGFFKGELLTGESIQSYNEQSFIKNDAFGGITMSSGDCDWILLTEIGVRDEVYKKIVSTIDGITLKAESREFISKAYTREQITSGEASVFDIIDDMDTLVSSTIQSNSNSIYDMLKRISEDEKNMEIFASVNSSIDDFLGETKSNTLSLTSEGTYLASKNFFVNDKHLEIYAHNFMPYKITSENILNEDGEVIGERTIEVADGEYTFITEHYNDTSDIVEILKIDSGKTYKRTTKLDSSIDGVSYDVYSEVEEVQEEEV